MLEIHGKLEVFNKTEAIEQLLEDEKIQNYVWNKLYKKEIFEGIRFPVGRNYEDITVSIQLFERIKIMALKEVPKYYYRVRKDSITKNKTTKTCSDYMNAILERYLYINRNIPQVTKYNSYNFVTCAIWLYSAIVTYDFNELYSKYEEIFEILKNIMISNQSDFIWSKLNYYRRAILDMMLLDKHMSKEAIKQLYLAHDANIRKKLI